MTNEQKIITTKAGILEPAKQLGAETMFPLYRKPVKLWDIPATAFTGSKPGTKPGGGLTGNQQTESKREESGRSGGGTSHAGLRVRAAGLRTAAG
jgi:hypothetical protein